MPDEEKNNQGGQMASPVLRNAPVSTESLQMLMANLGSQPDMPINEGHVTEMLLQRRQINEFINDDKNRNSWDQRYFLTVGLVFILLISALVIFTHPEYFTQVLSLIIGGFGGFGLGRGFAQN